MKKSTFSPCPNHRETTNGLIYLALQFLVLPGLLTFLNGTLDAPLSSAELNFTFYLLNFIAMLVIFHDFLGRSATEAFRHPILLLQAVILGLVAYFACTQALTWTIGQLLPSYSNYNDEAIAAMSQGNFFLMTVGTVILVPPYEECMFRGLIFRSLQGKNRLLAYLVSAGVFSLIHIAGYIGTTTPVILLLCFLQYIPAGLALGWAYEKADSICAPVLMHMAVNQVSISLMR